MGTLTLVINHHAILHLLRILGNLGIFDIFSCLPGQESKKVRNRVDPFTSADGRKRRLTEAKVCRPLELSFVSGMPVVGRFTHSGRFQ